MPRCGLSNTCVWGRLPRGGPAQDQGPPPGISLHPAWPPAQFHLPERLLPPRGSWACCPARASRSEKTTMGTHSDSSGGQEMPPGQNCSQEEARTWTGRCVLGHSGWWEAGCSLCPDPGRKQSSRGHFSDGTGQCSLACGHPQGPGSPAQGHTSGVCTNYSLRPGHRCSRDAHSVSR